MQRKKRHGSYQLAGRFCFISLCSSWMHLEGMAQRIQTSLLACGEKKSSLLWEPNFSTQAGSHKYSTSVGRRNACLAPTPTHQKWNLGQVFSCVAYSFFKIVFPLMHTNVMNIFHVLLMRFFVPCSEKKKSFDLFHTLNPMWQTSEMAAGCLFLQDLKTELKSLELYSDAFHSCNINIFFITWTIFPVSLDSHSRDSHIISCSVPPPLSETWIWGAALPFIKAFPLVIRESLVWFGFYEIVCFYFFPCFFFLFFVSSYLFTAE